VPAVNLHQRLKRLEARVELTDEPEEIVMRFVGPEKEVERMLVIRIQSGATVAVSSGRPARGFR
jgi:hypothetical protein